VRERTFFRVAHYAACSVSPTCEHVSDPSENSHRQEKTFSKATCIDIGDFGLRSIFEVPGIDREASPYANSGMNGLSASAFFCTSWSAHRRV
jgi:hypothetical protein